MKINRVATVVSVVFFTFVFSLFLYGDGSAVPEEDIDAKLNDLYRKYNITPQVSRKAQQQETFKYLKSNLLDLKDQLNRIEGEYSLLILKDEFIMLLYKGETFLKGYTIGVGMNKDGADKQKVNDNRTPEGHFHISKKHRSDYWKFEGKYAYGPWFLRLKTPWKGIGIHGTDTLDVLGTKSTHGCIRTDNASIVELKILLPIRTPVHIYRNQFKIDPGKYYLPDIDILKKHIALPSH